jgi:hypothetical protein
LLALFSCSEYCSCQLLHGFHWQHSCFQMTAGTLIFLYTFVISYWSIWMSEEPEEQAADIKRRNLTNNVVCIWYKMFRLISIHRELEIFWEFSFLNILNYTSRRI